jgi:nucleoside-diphosphate-sugar epimerase
VSTTCVCGTTSGLIPEEPLRRPQSFVNAYEESKWEAEGLVLGAGLPAEIVRLSIVGGSANDGFVRRPGALHHMLQWLYRGLVPMMPAAPGAAVDLISTEFAARVVTLALASPGLEGRVIHASAGEQAPRLSELLSHLEEIFAQHHPGWADRAVNMPDVVDEATFRLFEHSVRLSGDVLFQRVCADSESFLPSLLHPHTCAVSLARNVPLADWRALTERVFLWMLKHRWSAGPKPKAEYACA